MKSGAWLTPEIADDIELTILHAIIDPLERPRLSMKTTPSNNDQPRIKNLTKPKKLGMRKA